MMENPNLEDDNKPKRKRIPKVTVDASDETLIAAQELAPEKVIIKLEEDPIAKKKPKKNKLSKQNYDAYKTLSKHKFGGILCQFLLRNMGSVKHILPPVFALVGCGFVVFFAVHVWTTTRT